MVGWDDLDSHGMALAKTPLAAGEGRCFTLVVDVVAQARISRRMTQLLERLRLDLPDALARHAEVLADLFQRVGIAVVEPEPHLKDVALARRELIERLLDLLAQHSHG